MSEDELKAFERWTTTSDGANPCDDVEAGARHVTALVAEVRRLRTELALAQASDERAELRLDNATAQLQSTACAGVRALCADS
jgi:hypothetical protein